MSNSLPPLNALRAFEAAARRGTFVRAAKELFVTPAAISQQVKSLEDHIGVVLFRRHARGLTLTEAGRQLLPDLSYAFAHMARGVGILRGGGLEGPLNICVVPSFATLWLVPRLESFLKAYPQIEVTITAAWPRAQVDSGSADIGLTYGLGRYPGLVSKILMRETVFPVCAPGLLNQAPLREFADLAEHSLLHDIDTDDDEPTMTWRRWLRDAGAKNVNPDGGVKFGNSILLTEAALRGQGVALGRSALVADYLASGRLVRPLNAERPADYAYYTITTESGAQQPRVQAFLEWLEKVTRGDELEPD